MEQDTGNGSVAKEKIEGFDSPVSIHIHSVRNRLADPDGISFKAVIDGLVHAGILSDDTTKQIKEVTSSQEKTRGEEYTDIIIEEL